MLRVFKELKETMEWNKEKKKNHTGEYKSRNGKTTNGNVTLVSKMEGLL